MGYSEASFRWLIPEHVPQKDVMEAYSIFSKVLYILATLAFFCCAQLNKSGGRASERDKKPSGLSCPIILKTISLLVLKKEPSSFYHREPPLFPSPFTEYCFLRILKMFSKYFWNIFFNSYFSLQKVTWGSIFFKRCNIKLFPKLAVSLRPKVMFSL